MKQMSSIADGFRARIQVLKDKVERAARVSDGGIQARDLWDEHIELGDAIRDAAHCNQVSDDEWRELIRPVIECAERIVRLPLGDRFYKPRNP
jgi:hypothetical protein